MDNFDIDKLPLKYLTPENLYQQLGRLTAGMAVTRGRFELVVPQCTLVDFEWNHLDQLHRPYIHNTYEESMRIALGRNFAVSLTKWNRWPLFIMVTDVYVGRGLFYQSMTIAGIIFLHSVISMEKVTEDSTKLTHEWFIASHKLFKLLHKLLDRKLYKLAVRLQEEDAQIRHRRFALRKQGYRFKTDVPDYYNSNRLGENTIYPPLVENAFISLDDLGDEPMAKMAGNLEFIVLKKHENNSIHYLIWPSACPHEGGPLLKGKFCKNHVVCGWHGLRFNAVELYAESPHGARYGFEFTLAQTKIYVRKIETMEKPYIKVADF